MPAAARKTSDGVVHSPIPYTPSPALISQGSGDVNINSMSAARVGDLTTVHVKGEDIHFPAAAPPISSGSSTVFINGKKAARKGDQASCGAVIKSGSSNVNIGG